jgi:hypothetical protein
VQASERASEKRKKGGSEIDIETERAGEKEAERERNGGRKGECAGV